MDRDALLQARITGAKSMRVSAVMRIWRKPKRTTLENVKVSSGMRDSAGRRESHTSNQTSQDTQQPRCTLGPAGAVACTGRCRGGPHRGYLLHLFGKPRQVHSGP